jgi:hypothetical protein
MHADYHKTAAARIARLRRLTAIASRLHDIFAARCAAGMPTDHILPRARMIRAAIIAA